MNLQHENFALNIKYLIEWHYLQSVNLIYWKMAKVPFIELRRLPSTMTLGPITDDPYVLLGMCPNAPD